MLMCNICLDNGEQDVFIRCRALTNIESKISHSKIDEKLFDLEKKFTGLVNSKLATLILKSFDKIEEKCSKRTTKMLKKDASAITSSDTIPTVKLEDLNIPSRLRIQVVAEIPEKIVDANIVPTTEKIKNILQSFKVNTEVTLMKQLGQLDKTRVKPRILLVTVRNEYDKNLIMAKSVENLKNFTNKTIYFLHTLTKADVFKENQLLLLKKKRDILEEVFPREKLKIRNFKIFNTVKKKGRDR